MKFRIWTILWVFALLASAMATFGVFGILITGGILYVAIGAKELPALRTMPWLVTWLVGFGLLVYVTPLLGNFETAVLQKGCYNNLQSIAQAILEYETEYGSFPPPFSKDETGQALHSWRVLILPYLGQQALYESIRLEEPWDSKHNQQFWDQIPSLYRCPSCRKASEMGLINCSSQAANYYAIVGANTIWSKDQTIGLKDVVGKFSSLGDLTPSSTVLLMEFTPENGCWMQPIDLTAVQAANVLRGRPSTHCTIESSSAIASVSGNSVNVAYADGSAFTFSLTEGVEETLQEFPHYAEYELERNGNRIFWSGVEMKQRQPLTEKVEPEELVPAQFTGRVFLWRHLYSLLLFSFLSTLPVAKFARRA